MPPDREPDHGWWPTCGSILGSFWLGTSLPLKSSRWWSFIKNYGRWLSLFILLNWMFQLVFVAWFDPLGSPCLVIRPHFSSCRSNVSFIESPSQSCGLVVRAAWRSGVQTMARKNHKSLTLVILVRYLIISLVTFTPSTSNTIPHIWNTIQSFFSTWSIYTSSLIPTSHPKLKLFSRN